MRFVLALLVGLAGAHGTRAADFYAGKTVTILVGYAAGGGYDVNARLLARHLGRHIPGAPAVVVENMPGAGSLRSVEYLHRTAPKDGAVVNLFDFTQITNSLLTPERAPLDFRAFKWIGSMAQDLAVCYVARATHATTLQDAQKLPQIHMGRTNPGSSSDIEQQIFRKIFKVNVQSVAGYAGSAEAALALDRGELDGGCLTWSSLPPAWSAEKKIVPILKLSSATAPDLPADLPNALDIAPSARDRQIVEMLSAAGKLGKPLIVDLAVPDDRAALLRQAFEETMRAARAGRGRRACG